MWDWIGKNSPSLMFLIAIGGWVWSYAMLNAKVQKITDQRVEDKKWQDDMELGFRIHQNDTKVHRDPDRDEQRLKSIETAIQDMMRILREISQNTRGLQK